MKLVLRGQRRLHKTRVDGAHPNAVVLQIQVQRFCQMGERGLGGSVGQAVGQAPKTGHAADQADVALAARQHGGQHRVQHIERAHVVHLVVLQHHIELKVGGAHGLVHTGAVHHQVQWAVGQQGLGRLGHRCAVGAVQRQGLRAGVGVHKTVQRRGRAGRDDHLRAPRVQGLCGGAPNAGGGAHQPDALPLPLPNGWVHGFTNVSVTSPRRKPNLLITALLIITLSFIRYIQSSSSTFQTLPSTGSAMV